MAVCRYCDGDGFYYVVPIPENMKKLADAVGVKASELETMKRTCFCKREEKHGRP